MRQKKKNKIIRAYKTFIGVFLFGLVCYNPAFALDNQTYIFGDRASTFSDEGYVGAIPNTECVDGDCLHYQLRHPAYGKYHIEGGTYDGIGFKFAYWGVEDGEWVNWGYTCPTAYDTFSNPYPFSGILKRIDDIPNFNTTYNLSDGDTWHTFHNSSNMKLQGDGSCFLPFDTPQTFTEGDYVLSFLFGLDLETQPAQTGCDELKPEYPNDACPLSIYGTDDINLAFWIRQTGAVLDSNNYNESIDGYTEPRTVGFYLANTGYIVGSPVEISALVCNPFTTNVSDFFINKNFSFSSCAQYVSQYLFIPSDTISGNFTNLLNNIKQKPPIGWIVAVNDMLSDLSIDGITPAFELEQFTPVQDNIINPIRTGLQWVFYFIFVVYLFHRFKDIQL